MSDIDGGESSLLDSMPLGGVSMLLSLGGEGSMRVWIVEPDEEVAVPEGFTQAAWLEERGRIVAKQCAGALQRMLTSPAGEFPVMQVPFAELMEGSMRAGLEELAAALEELAAAQK